MATRRYRCAPPILGATGSQGSNRKKRQYVTWLKYVRSPKYPRKFLIWSPGKCDSIDPRESCEEGFIRQLPIIIDNELLKQILQVRRAVLANVQDRAYESTSRTKFRSRPRLRFMK